MLRLDQLLNLATFLYDEPAHDLRELLVLGDGDLNRDDLTAQIGQEILVHLLVVAEKRARELVAANGVHLRGQPCKPVVLLRLEGDLGEPLLQFVLIQNTDDLPVLPAAEATEACLEAIKTHRHLVDGSELGPQIMRTLRHRFSREQAHKREQAQDATTLLAFVELADDGLRLFRVAVLELDALVESEVAAVRPGDEVV